MNLSAVTKAISALRQASRPRPVTEDVPEEGIAIPFVDHLSPTDVATLNRLLPWRAFVRDAHGRCFGQPAWSGKRSDAQPIPDPRILRLDDLIGLSDKSVLEVGCFEGIHTVGLLMYAQRVVAVDARIENVVKTIVRCGMFDLHPSVFQHDLDEAGDLPTLPAVDVLHHVGVLYHLTDPVGHLSRVTQSVGQALLLDSHFAEPEEITESYSALGRTFPVKRYREAGREDAFSGMGRYSRWLLKEDIESLIVEMGFDEILHQEVRAERNGPRLSMIAKRSRVKVGR